jgi:hypothetical protein
MVKFQKVFRVSPAAEEELQNLVGALERTVPQLKEIRVFGNYVNGTCDPDDYGLNIFVLTADEYFSCQRDQRRFDDGSDCAVWISESVQREDLRKRVFSEYASQFGKKLYLNILSQNDLNGIPGEIVPGYKEAYNNPIKTFLSGRLLYRNPNLYRTPSINVDIQPPPKEKHGLLRRLFCEAFGYL